MTNLSLIFHVQYYDKLGQKPKAVSDHFESMNAAIANSRFYHQRDHRKLPFTHQSFLLQTAYPGLLTGSGNPHGSKQSKEEINMGFSFDFVSGQPFLPGSSVKGMLRSCFTDYPEEVARLARLEDIGAVRKLEQELFEGNDVCFDAVVYDGDPQHHVVGFDSITPHASPTKSPIPLSILKILPQVKLEFRFQLTNGTLSADRKLELFRQLLKLFGIGAKTNVGYGILLDCDETYHGEEQPRARQNTGATMKICPHCGRKNFKYRRVDGVMTDTVNWNWEKNICFNRDCRGDLG